MSFLLPHCKVRELIIVIAIFSAFQRETAATIKASKLFPDSNLLKTNRCHKLVYDCLVCVTKHAAKSQTRRLELCIVVSAKTLAVFL